MPTPSPRRAWGTRFDSLVENPSLVGSSVAACPESNVQSRDTTADMEDNPDAVHTAAEKERSDVEHDYPQPPSSGAGPGNIDMSSLMQARMPHDASVFVASLPSHVPEAELQVLLSEHLSRHATIKHIKLIRDNRGTVCAFVQVESSAQASELIAACNMSPFMERHIRCERARAFRTLLVSWRPVPISGLGLGEAHSKAQEGIESRPFRLRRCRGTKYIQVTHGSEAVSSDVVQLPNYTPPRPEEPLSGSGLLFSEGLKEGDFESLKSLLEAFGPLEFITPFDAVVQPSGPRHTHALEAQSRDENALMLAAPASDKDYTKCESEDGPGRAVQPPRPMWAVKWEHRNDAVSAITALQYLPFLFVCWSHTYGRPHHPPHLQNGGYSHSRTSSGFYTQSSHPSMPFGPNDGHPQPHLHPHTPAQLTNEQDAQAQWVVVPPATQAGARLQQLHAQAPIVQVPKIEPTDTPITFSESDFPPLGGDAHTGVVSGGSRGKGKRGAWLGKRSFIRAGAPSPPPISTTVGPTVDRLLTSTDSTRPGSPNSAAPRTPDLEAAIEPSPITPAFPSTPRTPSGGYGPPHPEEVRKNAMYASQITQGFNAPYGSGCTATSGYLPPSALRTGQGQMFTAPQTTVFTMSNPCSSLQPQLFPARRLEDMPERTCDGRELFIGGLDVETWDEARVKDVFSQYGAIEDVRFVKPGYHAPAHRRAFAFVKFTDRDAPLRAITEEHLRVYDDRKIKVQLREANPPRKWSCRGGRGRFYQGHGLLRTDRESLDYDHSSSTGEALAATEECEEEPVNDGGHVRFASAPEVGSSKADDLVDPDSENVREPSSALDSKPTVEPQTEETENTHEAGSVASSWSDPAPDVSMETQNNSASTTATLADVTISPPSPRVETTQQQQELQSDPDSQTVSSTPPPSILDASIYAPSSAGSAPVNGYYQTPSWIPPYAVPPAPYPYGYYPQQVAGQQAADGSNTYPWMAALYRNVVPLVPWFNPPPGVELAPAPVRPTGYIQRDPGGIFIPVYPPERLGQYMSTSGTAVDQSQTQSQPGAPPIGNWQNLPSHPQLYPVPFTMQQAMMVSQQASLTGHQAQQQQLPMTGNGWITGPPPGTAYPTQHAPSSAPPPYPTPNSYYPSQASVVPANSRPGAYGQYDTNMHHTPLKNSTRRGNDYGNRLGSGPREGRIPHQRRGPVGVPGMNGSDQSFPGVADPHWQTMKNNGIPTQLAMSTSGNASQWN